MKISAALVPESSSALDLREEKRARRPQGEAHGRLHPTHPRRGAERRGSGRRAEPSAAGRRRPGSSWGRRANRLGTSSRSAVVARLATAGGRPPGLRGPGNNGLRDDLGDGLGDGLGGGGVAVTRQPGLLGLRRSSLAGADVDPSTGGLLSIADLQRAMRARRAPEATSRLRELAVATGSDLVPSQSPRLTAPDLSTALPGWLSDLPGALLVVGAHPVAGASTVVVAVVDAVSAALSDRGAVQLLDCSPAARSGLAGVADAELGVGGCGRWRYGRRGHVLVARPVDELPPAPPCEGPTHPWATTASTPAVTVVDLGCGLDDAVLTAARTMPAPILVVFRMTLPDLQRVETVLTALDAPDSAGYLHGDGGRVLVAAVGPARWPRQIRACAGPRLRQAQRAGRVVPVPLDGRLALTGLGSGPLPRRVSAAGTRLWELAAAGGGRRPTVQRQGGPPGEQPLRPLIPFDFRPFASQEQQ